MSSFQLSASAPRPEPPTLGRRRGLRSARDVLSSLWIVAAIGAGLALLFGGIRPPQPVWTYIHIITVGVLTTGILHWSWYFARALLRLGADDPRATRDNWIRIGVLQVFFLVLIGGMWRGSTWLIAVAVAALMGVIIWHVAALSTAARTQLGSRFSAIIRYYQVASAFFLLAVACALLSALGLFLGEVSAGWFSLWLLLGRDALTVAHFVAAVGGWLLMSISGTLVTFYPTMLRTRMVESAVREARLVLPLWSAGVVLAVLGALVGSVAVSLSGFGTPPPALPLSGAHVVFFVGVWMVWISLVAGIVWPLIRAFSSSHMFEFPALSATVSLVWFTFAVGAYAVDATLNWDFARLRSDVVAGLPMLAAGGMLPLFLAALSFLTPVVTGGGPAAVKASVAVVNTHALTRVLARQIAALLLVINLWAQNEALTTALWLALGLITVWDLALIAWCVRASRHAALTPAAHAPTCKPQALKGQS